jgi:hypothetical protein
MTALPQGQQSPLELLSDLALRDLRRSGLRDDTIAQAGIVMASDAALPAVARMRHNTGYLIPYRSVGGGGFYRLRLLGSLPEGTPKYIQTQGRENHLYIPPQLGEDWMDDPSQDLIITEGEKKALKAVQEGWATVALGGVDSWRTHRLVVPKDAITKAEGKKGGVGYAVKFDEKALKSLEQEVIEEFLDATWEGRQVHLVFDSDGEGAANEGVRRAAFELALWLEDRGARVDQVVLPGSDNGKVGLDDFLCSKEGKEAFRALLERGGTFPSPPNAKSWVRKLLDAQAGRKVLNRVARGVLACLDEHGERFRDEAGTSYYFDQQTKTLHAFRFDQTDIKGLRNTTFGTLLMREFGLGSTDGAALGRLADLFASVQPVTQIQPRSVAYARGTEEGLPDTLYWSISDSRMAVVRAEGISFHDNGYDGVLFRSGLTKAVDEESITAAIKMAIPGSLWRGALRSLNIEPMGNTLTEEETGDLLAIHFHLSPYWRGWRGMMLPVEICVAEPNSGKTFLYNLRKGVYTGYPSLNSPPREMKDWYATIVGGDGMWACDNASRFSRDVRESLSDELARITTEPSPSIETRMLYTTMDVARFGISSTFAVTAVDNPFHKPDLLQRALYWRQKVIMEGKRDGGWYDRQLQDRALWVANQLVVSQKFLVLVEAEWDETWKSHNRLKNYEQATILMGQAALGKSRSGMQALMRKHAKAMHDIIATADPIIEALHNFAEDMERQHLQTCPLQLMVMWATDSGFSSERSGLRVLHNAVSAGHYFTSHEHDIRESAGLEMYKKGNRTFIRLLKVLPTDLAKYADERDY